MPPPLLAALPPPLLAALLLGFSAGLRSLTPLAVLAWVGPEQLAWLQGWIGRSITTVLAVGELAADKLPFTSPRIRPGPLLGRLLIGAAAGYLISQGKPGALVGAIGALIGTFGGYQLRRALTHRMRLPDLLVAIAEDAVAIGLAVAATRV